MIRLFVYSDAERQQLMTRAALSQAERDGRRWATEAHCYFDQLAQCGVRRVRVNARVWSQLRLADWATCADREALRHRLVRVMDIAGVEVRVKRSTWHKSQPKKQSER